MKNQKPDNIKKALEEAISSAGVGEVAVEEILKTLDKQKLFRYHRDSDVNLLSTAGRVLVAIIEDPTMTLRAISVYLDLSETMIDKTVKYLIDGGLITKTKANRRNVYKLNKKSIKEQQDIQHILTALKTLDNNENEHVGNGEIF
jgi:predicted transcriptional regulator